MSAAAALALAFGFVAVVGVYLALWLDHPPREALLPLGLAVVAGAGLGPAALAALPGARARSPSTASGWRRSPRLLWR